MADLSKVYEMGVSLATMNTLFNWGIPAPSQDPYNPYSVEEEASDGGVYGHGWAVTGFRYNFLRYSHRALLRVFCPGKSAKNIYVKLLNDSHAWVVCRTTMVWMSETPLSETFVGDVHIEFRVLEIMP